MNKTMKEVLDEYLRPEYLNVQHPEEFKEKLLAALHALSAPAKKSA